MRRGTVYVVSKKRLVLVALAAFVLLSSIVGVGSAAPITLKFWHGFNAHEITKLQELIDREFLPAHPEIGVDTLAPVSPEKILSSIAGGNPPDVAILWDSSPIASWAYNGALTPLDSYIEASNLDMDVFIQAGVDVTRIKGRQWAMPFVLYNQGFFWNKDLFEAAGLDPSAPPETIDTMDQYIEKLTLRKGQIIEQIGFIPQTDLLYMSYLFGGSLYDWSSNKITANHPDNVKALEWEVGLVEKYGVQMIQNFVAGLGQGGAGDNPFYLGKLGMTLDGVWQLAFMPKYAPDLNFGVAPFPYPIGRQDLKDTNLVGTNPVIIPAGAKHPKEAWEFIQWLTTSEAVATEFSGYVANLPHIKGLKNTFSSDPDVRLFVEMAEHANARVIPPIPVIEMYVNEFTAAADKAYNLQGTPKELLDAVTSKMQKELDKIKW